MTQRLDGSADLFARPDGDGLRLCRPVGDGLEEGPRIAVSTGTKLAISGMGWFAALSANGREALTARIAPNLSLIDVTSTAIGPSRMKSARPDRDAVTGRSVLLAGERLFVGGRDWAMTWLGERAVDRPEEPFHLATLPREVSRCVVDELLLHRGTLLVIDDVSFPKYALAYPLTARPIKEPALVVDLLFGSHLKVHDASAGDRYVAVLAYTHAHGGSAAHIHICDARTLRGVRSIAVTLPRYERDTGYEPGTFVPERVASVSDNFILLGHDGTLARVDARHARHEERALEGLQIVPLSLPESGGSPAPSYRTPAASIDPPERFVDIVAMPATRSVYAIGANGSVRHVAGA